MKKLFFLIVIFLVSLSKAAAEFREQEPVIYPAGFPTADVLQKSEFVFAPHGWTSFGFHPKMTGTVDWLTTTFGVPSGGVRYQLPAQNGNNRAIELYGLYSPRTITSDRYNDKFEMKLKGASSWLHAMQTLKMSSKTRIHFYAGLSYMEYLEYLPKENVFEPNAHEDIFTPDAGVAFEQTINKMLRINVNAYYGNSVYYYDQDPRKYVMTYGVYWTPFSSRRHPFFSNMRLEINGYYAYIPYAEFHFFSVPFFPILTWQWGG